MFESEYKQFFCRFDEPSYIKSIKLEILTYISTEHSLHDILCELAEYVTDVDVELSKKAVKSMGKIAQRLPCA